MIILVDKKLFVSDYASELEFAPEACLCRTLVICSFGVELLFVNPTDMSCSCLGSLFVQKKEANIHRDFEGHSLDNIRNFSYKELLLATYNFDRSTKIGRGGFGVVYKGILKDGTQVAVKTLGAQSKQGVREFLAEVNTISNVKHQNLVELIGCCVEGSNRILVYEFVENNSLDHALLGKRSKITELDWERRSKICIGIARGLAYLHEELEPRIVHRDIKASNILLDKDFNPKIGDFGLAKLFPDSITHISTKLAGTTGYLAPEYVFGGQLTLKADVYSFGVLVLETISGRSSSLSSWGTTQKVLLEWAWELYEKGKLLELVDHDLTTYPKDDVIKIIQVREDRITGICSRWLTSRCDDMAFYLYSGSVSLAEVSGSGGYRD
ncbi:hypothetical protein E3N88_05181 [Mikania micrantha]|uniref:non-specific serine/threonine protein kinase n=1 Tax=Mikania micrantha TaxID=192012 RepID=A0A5N6PXG5_9ASTR|nr:hypothetical protein E3N88_05181 [Mikania micrantha]